MKTIRKNSFIKILFELLVILLTHQEDHDQYVGDIEEMYSARYSSEGRLRANIFLFNQIIKSIPAFVATSLLFGGTMLRNYLKITLRNLWRNKTYSVITILGATISFAACFLILQYVGFEKSYDNFHKNKSSIYRITNDRYQDNKLIQHGVITYPSVAKQMKSDFPEIKNFTRIIHWGNYNIRNDETSFSETIAFADSAFLSMFTFPLIEGDVNTALAQLYSILFSESTARKYFGNDWKNKNIIGKTVKLDNKYEMTVTGVFEDVPSNSHMHFDVLVSFLSLSKFYGEQYDNSWTNSNFMCYLQLVRGTDPVALENKFQKFSETYFKGNEVTGYYEKFHLQPLTDIHLHSDYEYESWVHGNSETVNILMIIAVFILVISWVNSINLTTAKSLERAKEVGLRKVIGARRSHIVKQFLLESLFINIIALVLAVIILIIVQPELVSMLSINFVSIKINDELTLYFLLLFLTGTIISGFYPALLTSSFRLNSVLKGKLAKSGMGQFLRKTLVVFQFALSFALIAGTYAVYSQVDFMMNKKLGINIDQTLVVSSPYLTDFDSTFINKIDSYKSELLSYPGINSVATSRRLPGSRTGRIFNVKRLSGGSDERFTTADIGVDYNFFQTFSMTTLAGRTFDRSDHNYEFAKLSNVVINKACSDLLEYKNVNEAIGQRINFWGKDWEIIGVVNNHHNQSLHVPVEPTIFTPQYSSGSYHFIKMNTADVSGTISTIENEYKKFFPGNAFSYFFLDEYFNKQYQSDLNFRTLFLIFASLGILLACLGLFGLASFTISQRTKEIGIRKVSGATTTNVLFMLLSYFLKLVLVSAIISSPLTFYALNMWLEEYAYRISIGWNIMLIPAAIILIIALFTVGFKSIKASLANPIESIKYE